MASPEKASPTLPQSSPSQYSAIESLPDDLLLRIMTIVSDQPGDGVPSLLRLAEVNRRFLRVARDPVLWHHLVLRDCEMENHIEPALWEAEQDLAKKSSGASVWTRTDDRQRLREQILNSPFGLEWRQLYLKTASFFRHTSSIRAANFRPSMNHFRWNLLSLSFAYPYHDERNSLSMNYFSNLHSLEQLTLGGIYALSSFEDLCLQNLRSLNVRGSSFPDFAPYGLFGRFPRLESLSLAHVQPLTSIDLLPSQSLGRRSELFWPPKQSLEEIRDVAHPCHRLPRLSSLSIQGCEHFWLPNQATLFLHLTTLSSLRLVGLESVITMPDSISLLSSLTHLTLSLLPNVAFIPTMPATHLVSIWLGSLPSMPSLLPSQILQFSNITDVTLTDAANLTCIPPFILQDWSSKLTSLKIHECSNLHQLPEDFGVLTKLSRLHLSRIPMIELPSSICLCESLKDLILNDLTSHEGNFSFSTITSLTSLDLKSISSLSTMEPLESLTNLRQLSVVSCPVGFSFDESLPFSLETMYLEKIRSMHHIPAGISALSQLSSLRVHECPEVRELVSTDATAVQDINHHWFQALQKLQRLEFILCSHLASLPDSISDLLNLNKLAVAHSQVRGLPASISALTKLTSLSIRDSRLTGLPDGMSKLIALRVLQVDECSDLPALPEGVSMMSELRELGIRCTGLTSLPSGLFALTNLPGFFFQGHPNPLPRLRQLPEISGMPESLRVELRGALARALAARASEW